MLLVSNKGIRSSRINSDLGGIYNIYSIYSFPSQAVTAILPFVSSPPDNFFQTLPINLILRADEELVDDDKMCFDKIFEACLDKFQLPDLVAAGWVCPLRGVTSG